MAGENQAGTADQAIARRDPMQQLQSAMEMFSGKTATTTESPTTTTTKSNLTAEQLQALIDSAMAPLNQAAHAAGIIPFTDTTLALGRSQIAAETAAKYAGTTTSTSGGTKTVVQQPTLSKANLGKALPGMLLTQGVGAVANPIMKALAKKTGLDQLGKKGASMIEGIGSDATGSSQSAIQAATDADLAAGIGAGTSASMDALAMASPGLADSLISSSEASIAADALSGSAAGASDSILDTAAQYLEDFGDWLGFKDGGVVNVKKYADGGQVFIDRAVPMSTVEDKSKQNPLINALMEQYQTKPTIDAVNIPEYDISSLSGGADAGTTGTTEGSVGSVGTSAIGAGNVGTSMGIAAASAIGGPVAGLAVALGLNAMDAPQSVQSIAISALAEALGISSSTDSTSSNNSDASNATGIAGVGLGDANAGPPGDSNGDGNGSSDGDGGSAGSTGDGGASGGDGGGASGGDGGGGGGGGDGGEATGGNIRGPGNGTSDSIPARLSNGERVITAKTNQAIEELFPGFFHMLEQEFNPQAAAVQQAKGKA